MCIGLMTSCSVICHVIGYVFCLAIVQAISHVIVYGIWYDMSNVIGYTIRDISIGYSIGYVTCNASNIPLACAFASNIFGLDLRHCLRILLSDFCRSRSVLWCVWNVWLLVECRLYWPIRFKQSTQPLLRCCPQAAIISCRYKLLL